MKYLLIAIAIIIVLFLPNAALAKVGYACNADTQCDSPEKCVMTAGTNVGKCTLEANAGGSTAQTPASAPANATSTDIEPLPVAPPRLQIPIPGVEFSGEVAPIQTAEGKAYPVPFLGEYIAGFYQYAIGFAGLLAVFIMLIAGVIWVFSLGESGRVLVAKKMMSGAVLGLVLTMGLYTVLTIVNPDLLKFEAVKIRIIKGEYLKLVAEAEATASKAVSFDGFDQKTMNPPYTDLGVPTNEGCNVSPGSKHYVPDTIREQALTAQHQTGYPAPVMLAQWSVEGCKPGSGSCFGIKCPTRKYFAEGPSGKEEPDCGEGCVAGFTWECLKKQPAGGTGTTCGKEEGHYRIYGYACFKKTPAGNPFNQLVNFYENNTCIKGNKEKYNGNPAGFAKLLQSCKYATSPTYAAGLVARIKSQCLVSKAIVAESDTESEDKTATEAEPAAPSAKTGTKF